MGESYPMSQRGDPLGKNLEEIQACHWSDSKNTGFLLAETAGFLKIQKNIMSNLYILELVIRAVLLSLSHLIALTPLPIPNQFLKKRIQKQSLLQSFLKRTKGLPWLPTLIYIYILELVIRAVLLSFPELIPNPSSIINPFPQEENPSIVLHAAILEKDKRTNGTDSLQNHTKPLTLIVPK